MQQSLPALKILVILFGSYTFIGVTIWFFKMPMHTMTFNEGLLLAALPSGPMIVLLATRYKQYQQQASSILAVTTVGMLITVTALITMI